MATRAVLDACVLYPVSLRDVLLRCAESGLIQVVWSNRILNEMKRAILGNRPDLEELRLDRMIEQMQSAFPEANTDGWEILEAGMTNNEKDRHVLAVAVRSKSNVIVTSNLRHFPTAACAPHCVDAITPDDLLCQLFEMHERAVRRVIERLSLDTRNPPMTVAEVLAAVGHSAPAFAARARE